MEIAVLGGGAGCYAAAADLSEQGHSVRLWRRNAVELAPVIERGGIILKDAAGRREAPLALATADLAEAINGAALILIPLPAFAQADIASQLCARLCEGQVVFLPPGTFGSYLLADAARHAGNSEGVLFAETGTLPYLTRKRGRREIAITIRANRLPTGVFPAVRTAQAMDVLQRAYPSVEAVEDILSGALMNAGPIIHPPLILMNAAPKIVQDNMRSGHNGLREGKGLYDWRQIDKHAYRRDVLARLVSQLRSQQLLPKPARTHPKAD